MADNPSVPVPISQRRVIANKYLAIDEVKYTFRNETFQVITKTGPPVVSIVPFLDDDTLLLIKQYRFVWGVWSWELPAGHQDPTETLEEGAHRELEEETGFDARVLAYKYQYFLSAISPQPFHLFHARELTPTQQHLDHEELITVCPTSLAKAREMLESRAFFHAPSIIALQDLFLSMEH